MRGVVEPGGTGIGLTSRISVAGKTGTGQKSHLKKRGYADDMWVSTFFGVAPADNPSLQSLFLWMSQRETPWWWCLRSPLI